MLLARAGSDQPEAEGALPQAVVIVRHQGNRLYELNAATIVAQWWRQQGRPAAAMELLEPVYGWFTEGLGTRPSQRARAVLSGLSVS